MEIIDFSEYRSEQQRIKQEVDSVYQAILSSCTNPEYVAKCLQDMGLVDQTEKLLLKSKILQERDR